MTNPARITADNAAKVFLVHNGVQSATPIANVPAQLPSGSAVTVFPVPDPGEGTNCLRVIVDNTGGGTGMALAGVLSGAINILPACGE